jgi:hypothetical protein
MIKILAGTSAVPVPGGGDLEKANLEIEVIQIIKNKILMIFFIAALLL